MKKHKQVRLFVKEKRDKYELLLKKHQEDKEFKKLNTWVPHFDISDEKRECLIDILQDFVADLIDVEEVQ